MLEADAPAGTYHVANRGAVTWLGLAAEALRIRGIAAEVIPVSTHDVPRPAPRPRDSVLDCSATEIVVGPLAAWEKALCAALAEGLLIERAAVPVIAPRRPVLGARPPCPLPHRRAPEGS